MLVLHLAALAMAIGPPVFFALAVAPASFRVLPTRDLAGSLQGPILTVACWLAQGSFAVLFVSGWLLDTNVLSELRRPKPDAKVVQFVAGQALDLLYVSVVTFAEIRFGIELLGAASRRMELSDWLDHKLRPTFEGRVLDINEEVMLKWRLLVEEGRKFGHTFSQPDLIIAATALSPLAVRC